MNCIHKDTENGWCKLHSSWSEPMPVIEYCVEGPCPDEQPTEPAETDVKVLTNADRIRSMSDEELAREMLFFVPSDFNRHYTGIAGGYYATADEAIQANFDWLKQPVKEE